MTVRRLLGCFVLVALAGCASSPKPSAPAPAKGGYYQNDGPGSVPPADVAAIPDAEPKDEPLHRFANRPYQVFGKSYVPSVAADAYRERGVASWYGRQFHGQKTASGEIYDMYAMTAAHKTLPIPSYVRVTNPANRRSVVVRVNDRGPFIGQRLIDLSWTAATKLDIVRAGSAMVEIERVFPGRSAPILAGAPAEPAPPPMPNVEPAREEGRALADVAPPSDAAALYTLQLGAFASFENAEALRIKLQGDLGEGAQTLTTEATGNRFRVRLGRYTTRSEAEAAAQRVQTRVGAKPWVVTLPAAPPQR
jgi:rare lipoprotein A